MSKFLTEKPSLLKWTFPIF